MEITPNLKQQTEELFKQRYLEQYPDTVWINPQYQAKCVDLVLDCIKDFDSEVKAVAFIDSATTVLSKYGYLSANDVIKNLAKEIIGR